MPSALAATEQLNALLMKQGGEPKTIDLVGTFGEGYSFTVEGTNGAAVAATIDANGVLSLAAGELGHSDIRIVATNALGETVTEDFRVRVAGENAYTIAVLPDTQDYSANYAPSEIFSHMTQWLVDNKDSLQIQFVTHVGDVTYGNNDAQWQRAEAALRILDGKIPYALLPGNHDLASGGSAASRSNDLLSKYFPVAEQALLPGFGGVYDKEPESYNNNYSTFTAPDDTKWLVLSLEFGPRDDVLRWAGDVVEDHLDHRVILTTHGYMAGDGRIGPVTEQLTGENGGPSYGVGNDVRGSSDGDGIWQKFVSKYPNISFTFSGHNFIDGAETQIDYGAGGQPVFQMMVNYQNGVARESTGNGEPALGSNGGNGAIRLITIDPDNNAIYTETYFTELDDYMDGSRGKDELDRDGLTGPYRGHQETYTGIDMGTPAAVPLAKAGHDLSISAPEGDVASVALDASATIVPAGRTPSYAWKDADGKVVATGATATLDLTTGSHVLTLEVTAANGYVSRDEVRITVAGDSTLLVDNFNDGDSNGWSRPDAPKLAEFGSPADFAIPAMAGGEADVLKFPHYTAQQGLALRTNATSPTGDGLLWSYSIVMDLLIPDEEAWTSIFQTQLNNTNDADVYLRNDGDGTGSFGINGVYNGDFKYGQWQRVAFTVERQGTGNTVVLKSYIDGQLVGTQSINDANRFSIYADRGLLLFSDDGSDTSRGYLNSLLFSDHVLTDAEIAGFGAADADGIASAPVAGSSQFDFSRGSLGPTFGAGALTVQGSASTGTPLTVVGTVQSGVVDGEGALKDLTNNGSNVLIWDKPAAKGWSDYVYDLTIGTVDNSGKIGVVFAYQDPQNHYRLTFDINGNARSLVKVQNGTETVLANMSQGLIMGAELDLRVVLLGGEIRVLLDGKDVFGGPVVDTDPVGRGTVGVISQTQDGASFDNIMVNRAMLTAHGESAATAFDFDGDGFASVSVTAGASFGPDEIVAYRWLLDGQEVGTGKNAVLSLPAGTGELLLEVTDSSGKVATDLVPVETVAKDRILLSEGFSGDLSKWALINEGENGVAANWRIENGQLVQDADVSSRQLLSDWNASANDPWKLGWSPLGDGDYILRKGAYALYQGEGALDWKDYSIQAKLTGGGNDVMGLLFYYQDPDNYYKLELDSSTGYFQLTRLVDGVESIMARTAGRYALGQALDLRVDIKNHVIDVYVDGERVFANAVEDRNHAGGSFALYNWSADGGVAYDDVTVVSLASDAPTGPILGTAGDDDLVGTAGDDVILAGAGDDIVQAGAGNDRVEGGTGDDELHGEAGNDTLIGGVGDDRLFGGAGDDLLQGGTGDDVLDGGEGNDTADYSDDTAGVIVDLAAGTASGDEAGEDELVSIENVIGGTGDDVIAGNSGNNRIAGGAGRDTLVLAAATDVIALDLAAGTVQAAGLGSDVFTGIEAFRLGADDDRMIIAAGAETVGAIDGGAGHDTLVLTGSGTLGALDNVEAVELAGDWTLTDEGYDVAFGEGAQKLTIGAALLADGGFAGTITGFGQEDGIVLSGLSATEARLGAGNLLTLTGGAAGPVTLQLDPGQDFSGMGFVLAADGQGSVVLTYGPANGGDDVFIGGNGDDVFDGGAGNDTIKGGAGDDTLWGGAGDDRIDGGSGDDVIDGGTGNDIISAGSGDDHVTGGEGDDVIDAGSGDDIVLGGAGNDVIDAGSGDDRIEGGAGDDILTGGSGHDVFVFAAGFGKDVITDFKTTGSSSDILQFASDVFADFDAAISAAHQEGSDTIFAIDADTSLMLKNVQLTNLHADDFRFV